MDDLPRHPVAACIVVLGTSRVAAVLEPASSGLRGAVAQGRVLEAAGPIEIDPAEAGRLHPSG